MIKGDKTYHLIVRYNDETEEIEYLQETIDADDIEDTEGLLLEEDLIALGWDEEGLNLISQCYCFGIA
jgi:hypothetical protein